MVWWWWWWEGGKGLLEGCGVLLLCVFCPQAKETHPSPSRPRALVLALSPNSSKKAQQQEVQRNKHTYTDPKTTKTALLLQSISSTLLPSPNVCATKSAKRVFPVATNMLNAKG